MVTQIAIVQILSFTKDKKNPFLSHLNELEGCMLNLWIWVFKVQSKDVKDVNLRKTRCQTDFVSFVNFFCKLRQDLLMLPYARFTLNCNNFFLNSPASHTVTIIRRTVTVLRLKLVSLPLTRPSIVSQGSLVSKSIHVGANPSIFCLKKRKMFLHLINLASADLIMFQFVSENNRDNPYILCRLDNC